MLGDVQRSISAAVIMSLTASGNAATQSLGWFTLL